jgi:hypothetical protein
MDSMTKMRDILENIASVARCNVFNEKKSRDILDFADGALGAKGKPNRTFFLLTGPGHNDVYLLVIAK